MPRYRLIIEYDGGPYRGWQRQENGPSVQAEIEGAIERLTGERAVVHGAGRTDTGVHAFGQVAHVDLTRDWRPDKLRDALNAHLRPAPVSILAVASTTPDFHARFSALGRHYVYRIVNRRAPLALDRGRAWQVMARLDHEAMHHAAQCLVGNHDFTTFRSSECQAASAVKTLDRLDVMRHGDMIEIFASARSFLHNQVRSMVGSVKLVGEGRWDENDLIAVLAAQDRSACGPVAPPDGLYLSRVDYP
ncbi:MAG: tRNA pseudouridine(38-40) synthase TruA [Hyphomicrobiales bacterium]